MSRKELELNTKKQYIISCAQSLFIEKGFENTSMDDIASCAEFSKTTVYKYFESKDLIMTSILDNLFNEHLVTVSRDIDLITDTNLKIKHMIISGYKFINENIEFFQMYFINETKKMIENDCCATKNHMEMHNKHEAYTQKFDQLTSNVINEAIKKGILKNLHIDYYITLLNGALMMYAKRKIMGQIEIKMEESIDIFMDILYNGFAIKEQ